MKKKVFVLEDDKGIREVIEMILDQEDYEVSTFATIKDFSQANQTTRPDLYLLDIMLPDGNGIEVCDELKNSPQSSKIPILMMSAHARAEDMRKKCEAEAFIAKPFDMFHLIDQVSTLLEGNRN